MSEDSRRMLELTVKVIMALSAGGGLLALALGFMQVEFKELKPRTLGVLGMGLLIGSVLLGVADYVVQEKPPGPAPGGGAGNSLPKTAIITNTGSVNSAGNINAPVFVGAQVGDVTINQGDSEAVRQEKRTHAERLIGSEITRDLVVLDNRLGLLATAFARDDFDQQFDSARSRIAPGTAKQNAESYRRLMAVQRAASLRQAFNSERLQSDLSAPLMQNVVDALNSGHAIRHFLGQVAEVERVTDLLLSFLESQSSPQAASGPEEIAFLNEQLSYMLDRVRIYTQGTYLDGLRALDQLGPAVREDAATSLATLSNLQPRHAVGEAEYVSLRDPVLQAYAKLIDRHKRLVETQQQLRDAAIERFANLNASLRIDRNDSWQTVVAKATSLRELGRISDAMAAYDQYGKMFASSDSSAPAYAKTAREFTRQLTALGVPGGVYVFAVPEKGTAAHAGLRVGDILVGYAGDALASVPDFAQAVRKSMPADVVRLEYLRLTPDGLFVRQVVTVPGGPLGVGVMPI